MRISDWSSDVCSSDLLADAERPSLGVVLAGNRRPRHWATGKAQGFDAFDAKTEALALLSAAGAPVDNLQVFGEAGAAWHPGQSGTLRLGPRSEEHTSELQSLMRNSYAVFCLKNQNHDRDLV